MSHVHTAVLKTNNRQGPAVGYTELYAMLCGGLDGQVVWGEWIHACVWLIPFILQLKLSQCCLLIEYTPIESKQLNMNELNEHTRMN